MKRNFLIVILLLSLFPAWGQSTAHISNLSLATGATPALTFDVSWAAPPSATPNHRDSIWLFADYRIVNPDGSTGAWTPAGITTATIISGAGTLIASTLPGRGFFLDGHGLTTLNTTIRVTLDAPTNERFNACVYASDWPPNATMNAGGGYTLNGSPPFIINNIITEPSRTFGAGTCITSITDATGCPGFIVNTAFAAGEIASTGETVCEGGTPAAINSITPASGGDNTVIYSWYKDGVLIAGATSAAYTPPPSDAAAAGIYIYTRKVRDNTCNSTPIASEGSWELTVNANPNVSISAPSTACPNSTFVVSASGGASYCFSTSGTCTPTTSTSYSTQSMPASGNSTVYVTVRNATGCTASTSTIITQNDTTYSISSTCGFSISGLVIGPSSWTSSGGCQCGWRLPTITEMACIYANHLDLFVANNAYWTSTDSGAYIAAGRAWVVWESYPGMAQWAGCTYFGIPSYHCYDMSKSDSYHVRCVK
ncbi:MAG: DUF1566 domain-containing protein [Prevotellaceae bacterium]|jgi:hypothetical protein|nr:DUF1566 domain-containing protein [Prevotellaceae bacterium]